MTFKNVGVVGSGIMGSGIAEVAASAGAHVTVHTRSEEAGYCSAARRRKSLAKQIEKGKRTQRDADELRARVTTTTILG